MNNQNTYSVTFKGGKLLLIIGLVPLIFGFMMVSSALMSLILDQAVAWDSFFGGLLSGSVFLGIGIVLVFLRPTVIVDREKLAVFEYWRVASFTFGHKETPFNREHWVSLTSKMQVTHKLDTSGRSERERYILFSLCIEDADQTIPLVKPGFYLNAVQAAENIAKFLNCDLRDRSGKEEVIRKAGELDVALKDRVRQKQSPAAIPEPPRGFRCVWTWKNGILEVITPSKPVRMNDFKNWLNGGLIIVVPLIVFWYGSPELMPKLEESLRFPFKAGFWLLWCILASSIILRQISKARTRQIITVGEGSLRLQKRGLFRATNQGSIPLTELEELTLDAPRPENQPWYFGEDQTLLARSDKKILHLGPGLSSDELNWLQDAIQFAAAQ